MGRPPGSPWSDRHPVLAVVMGAVLGAAVAGVVSGGLALVSGPPPEPAAVAVAPPPAPPVDPELLLNAEHCQKGAETLVDVGEVISTAGSVFDAEVITELDSAESRMARRAEVPSRRLTETFGQIELILRDLRLAIEAKDGVNAALDETLALISTLDGQCADVLATGTAHHPG